MRLKLLLSALFCFVFTWGQVTLYSTDFGTTTGVFPAGWTSSNTTNGFAAVTTSPSAGYAGASGSINARFTNTGTNGNIHTLTFANNLSTVGFNTITVLWGGRATATFTQPVTFEWSSDGVVWNPIAYTQVVNNATWALVNNGTRITLPAGAEGLTNLRFRWSITVNNNGNYQIDDFSVQGISNCPPPPNPSGTIAGITPACSTTNLTYSAPSPLLYWQTAANGTSTANPTTSPLSVTVSGTYHVRAFDGVSCWSLSTVSYTVIINNPVSITTQPVDRNIMETTNTTFSVAASNAIGFQWQVSTNGGATYNNVINGGVYSGATTNTLTITGATLSMNGYRYRCVLSANTPCPTVISGEATLTVTIFRSFASDIVAVTGSESPLVSSLINNNAPLTSTTGVRVWQFRVRDGGVGLNDADTLPTILTDLVISQQASNTVSVWSDGINTVALFDGTTFIATGTVTGTQIQFNGINVSVPDNTEKTLTLRLSLKCPMGVGAKDNDRFVFSVSNVNTTFSSSGSGKFTFSAATSSTTQNVIDVVATRLVFTQQPTNTGVGNTMDNVVLSANDVCGNRDLGYAGAVTITSTGSLANAPVVVNALAGVATFINLLHTATGTALTLNATAPGLTSAVSNPFNIVPVTIFGQGDFAVLGVNSNVFSCLGAPYSAGDDEVSIITFKDIQNGDVFYITDNGFERTTAGLWGDTEGVYKITRSGATISAGTVITFRLITNAPFMEFVSPDAAWTYSKASGFGGSVLLNTGGDQLFFMQGGAWNNPAGTHDASYTFGNLLYAFNTNNTWTSFGNSTQQSGLPKELRCFNMMPAVATDFLEYTGPTNPASKFVWIGRINNPANWTNRLNCAGYTGMHVGKTYNIQNSALVDGVWTGEKSSDWFDCLNWQTLKVPNEITDVVLSAPEASQSARIDASSPLAAAFGGIAKAKDLMISRHSVILEGSLTNKLEVHGNLTLVNPFGVLDMDDDNSLTPDGQLYLYGNWTNSNGTPDFYEGNGTVHFVGTVPQIINNVLPTGTEIFYNVVMNNNFDTAVSNDLIATGDLTIEAGKSVSIDSDGYIRVNKKLVHNGNFTIENNGQLIQVDDADNNTGTYSAATFRVKRNAIANKNDYVYWSSPTELFNITGILGGPRYQWDTTFSNTNGTQGNWVAATGIMTKGRGYAVAVPSTTPERPAAPATVQTIFTGKPINGQLTVSISRGNYNGPDYDADLSNPDNVLTTKYDDNWNLVGNPYSSAIDAEKFLLLNQTKIEGSVWIWKHGLAPTSTTSPFYSNFRYNYHQSDYIKYNGLGSTEPDTFSGKIASGQGFMVNMLHEAATPGTLSFSNSLRSTDGTNEPYDNTDFFRASNPNTDNLQEKHRVWLDIFNNETKKGIRTLVGYTAGATNQKDYLYDCFYTPGAETSLFSLIDNEAMIIQGRTLPFDKKDKVLLGINIVTVGTHTIAIYKTDGIFRQNQQIYLQDKLLNIIHNLKRAPYQFTSEKGRFDNRFVLLFNKSANAELAKVEDIENTVVVTTNAGVLSVYSDLERIEKITVFDITGRKVFQAIGINEDYFSTSRFTAPQQLLILKITLASGKVVTRKTIVR